MTPFELIEDDTPRGTKKCLLSKPAVCFSGDHVSDVSKHVHTNEGYTMGALCSPDPYSYNTLNNQQPPSNQSTIIIYHHCRKTGDQFVSSIYMRGVKPIVLRLAELCKRMQMYTT
ncbi:hypothetical protein ARMSODRAFT_965978, partial [Armillaria solidipes]